MPILRTVLAPVAGHAGGAGRAPRIHAGAAADRRASPTPAGMLTPDQRSALENVLADYEDAHRQPDRRAAGRQSTEPEAIEQYSIRVADAWKLGPQGRRRRRAPAGRARQSAGAAAPAHRGRARRAGRADRCPVQAHPAGRDRAALSPERLLRRPGGRRVGDRRPARQGTTSGAANAARTRQTMPCGWLPFLFLLMIILSIVSRTRRGRRRLGRSDWGRNAGFILGIAESAAVSARPAASAAGADSAAADFRAAAAASTAAAPRGTGDDQNSTPDPAPPADNHRLGDAPFRLSRSRQSRTPSPPAKDRTAPKCG